MANTSWKAHERRSAALIGGTRYPANMGGPIDVESSWAIGQCKEVKTLSLHALTRLAMEAERQGTQRQKVGLCIIKLRAGRGVPTPRLVVLTETMFRAMSGPFPGDPAPEIDAPRA